MVDQMFRWREPAARAAFRVLPLNVLSYVDTDARAFALTFDDGPHPDTTPPLLEVLARHQAKATFFLIGERVAAHEHLVARIAAEGHEIANHLMRDRPSILLPDRRFRAELAQVNALLAPYGPVRWFRPGSGWLTPRMVRSAADHKLRAVLGTLAAIHDGGAGDERITRRLVDAIRPGTIAVLHEGTDQRHAVVAATDRLLAELRLRGLAAVTVSDLSLLRRSGPTP